MSNHGNPNHDTTPPIKQAENLAAFLSDWSNLLTPSSAAETKTETAMGMGPRQRQPFSPHPPADLPLPLPSGRTLRRRNTFTNANSNSNDEGGGGGGTTSTSTDDGDGDDGARESLAVNFLRSSSLTLHEHEQQATHHHQNGPSHHRQRTTGRNGVEMPKRSPLCTRAVLHEETSARFGERGEGNMNMIYVPKPQPEAEAEAEAPDTESFSFGDDVPPAAAATSPDPDPESNTALTMTATKKQRMSANYAQSHLYPYQLQMQEQESSFFQGWNEERSSAFASMPNTHKDKEEASSADKEAGKKPGPDPQKGSDPNPINDTIIIRNNPSPYLHPHFQVFSPSHAQLHLSPVSHFHPQKHEHPDNNLLPLAAPYSPVRRQFGNEHYMSPGRPTPAAAAHSPYAVATDKEEAKMKATRDDGTGTKDLVHADLPPTFPNLSVKGVCTSTSSQRNAWDRKFNELLDFKQQHGHCDVPQTYAPNPKLGVWVNKQRMEHKNREDGNISTLTDERLEQLQSIGFRWAKRRGQVRWDEKYDELIQYAVKFGNCHVPTKFKENTALGRWVSTQRAEYKKFRKGEKSSLTAEKIQRLDSIGFAWFMALY